MPNDELILSELYIGPIVNDDGEIYFDEYIQPPEQTISAFTNAEPAMCAVEEEETEYIGHFRENQPISITVLENLANHHHIQSSPATDWAFTHFMGRHVTAVLIKDSGGNEWNAITITNIDNSNCVVNVGKAAYSGQLWAI